jgi:hypothetical protein
MSTHTFTTGRTYKNGTVVVNWRPTNELRLACKTDSILKPVLQQKWISDDAGRHEWRDVPIVILT